MNPPELKPEALYGVVGRIVAKIAPETEADPAAVLVQLLAGFGNVVGRNAYFQHEADRHYPNLFVTLIGETSKGRKGTSWGQAKRVLNLAFPEWHDSRIVSGLSTGEGLISSVRDPVEEPIFDKRTKTAEVHETDPGVEDKRLLAVETELATLLRRIDREGNTLSAMIRDAWDRGDLATLTKSKQHRATGAHVSILAHVTPEELVDLLGATEAANGFGNRFIWVSVCRRQELPFGGDVEAVDLSAEIAELQAAAEFASVGRRVVWSDEARPLWADIYGELSSGGVGIFGRLTSRAEAQTTRLALIYALLDRSAEIRRAHLLAALAIWDRSLRAVRELFGEGAGDPLAEKVFAALAASPLGLGRTQINNALGRNVKAERIDRALTALLEEGRAVCEVVQSKSGIGRPMELWRAV